MKRFGSKRKDSFIDEIRRSTVSVELDRLVEKCKFSFAYFTSHAAGLCFEDCNQGQLSKLLNKLKDYSCFPLTHWKTMTVGKSGRVLSIYGDFPNNSDFDHPSHVPQFVRWGRFRLEHSVRLVGFVVPPDYDDALHSNGHRFDGNTFYVVFLDFHHKFYKSGEAA